MSTKVKVGIAAVIVTALVALIVLDQKTAPTTDPKGGTPNGEANLTVGAPPTPRDAAILKRDQEIDAIREEGERRFGTIRPQPPAPDDRVKKGNDVPAPGKVIQPAGEEYVVVDNDTYEKIAKKKLGDGKWAGLIAEANPGVKATALRPGQKIVIPSKPEPKPEVAKAEEPKKPEPKNDPVFRNKDGQRIYTVEPGDTLSGISVKVYNTSRYVEKICDANKIEDPSLLHVGMKLVMPDLPRKEAAPTGGTTNTVAPNAAGKKTYTVQPGDNLWKIASRIAGDRGIEETMRSIVGLNPDKLKTIGDTVRAGLSLIMPE